MGETMLVENVIRFLKKTFPSMASAYYPRAKKKQHITGAICFGHSASGYATFGYDERPITPERYR